MIDLLPVDRYLFLVIYQWPHTPFLNQVAFFLSFVGTGGVIWLIFSLLLFLREEERDHWFFLPSAFVLVMTALSEYGLKMVIARPRPTDFLSTYSFPSTHAMLAFAFAYLLTRKEPGYAVWFYGLAGMIAWSRVYLGAHYPFDVAGGAILGIIVAWCALMLESFVRRRWIRKSLGRSKKIRSR